MSKRINVMISDKLNEKLDRLSDEYGMSKSSIVGFATGQFLDNVFKMREIAYGEEGMIKQAFQKMFDEQVEDSKE